LGVGDAPTAGEPLGENTTEEAVVGRPPLPVKIPFPDAHPLPPGPPPLSTIPRKLRAFIFTMDSLSGVIEAAARGGPAGEIRVRTSLQGALESLGVECDVAGSDAEMENRVAPDGSVPHDIIILDEWTLRAPGGGLRSWVRGREGDVYLLAFFGIRPGGLGGDFPLPEDHILTAYPESRGGNFLGWGWGGEGGERWTLRPGQQCDNSTTAPVPPSLLPHTPCTPPSLLPPHTPLTPLPPRQRSGVVWGKKADYFQNKEGWLRAAAALAPLHTTAPPGTVGLENTPGVKNSGTLSPGAWRSLLAGSSFFLGLGDPLLGPSALDAVEAGCVYINPTFGMGSSGVRSELSAWESQHPFLDKHVGPPYVCNAPLGDTRALEACIKVALLLDLPPLAIELFTADLHRERVKLIFKLN